MYGAEKFPKMDRICMCHMFAEDICDNIVANISVLMAIFLLRTNDFVGESLN